MRRGILCLGLGLVLLGAGSVATTSPSVDEIVAQHVAALGGMDAILAVHSFVRHGWYREGDFYLDNTYVAQMRPFYRVIGSPEHELDELHEGYDGSAWEYYPDPGLVVRTGAEAARTTRHSAMFDDALVTYRAAGTAFTYGGTQRFLGKTVYVLHGVLADGFHEDYFVDSQTFLIDGRSEVVPMHAYGRRYHTYNVFGDYRAEGGVMMSHSFREVDSATGKVLDSGGDSRIDINPSLSARYIFATAVGPHALTRDDRPYLRRAGRSACGRLDVPGVSEEARSFGDADRRCGRFCRVPMFENGARRYRDRRARAQRRR